MPESGSLNALVTKGGKKSRPDSPAHWLYLSVQRGVQQTAGEVDSTG
jgi:hypothetical protein